MINECFIQFERNNYAQFIVNAKNLLFGQFSFVLQADNINGNYWRRNLNLNN